MQNIWLLTFANLRKNKPQAVSVLTVILLATALLSIGLVVFIDIGRFFDERATYLHAPHFAIAEERFTSNNDRLEFIQTFPGVVETETQNIIGGVGGYYIGDVLNAVVILIADGSVEQEMNPLSLIGDYLPLEGDAIYIPHVMFLSGYELGDSFELNFLERSLEFTVAGSTEDVTFGDAGIGNMRVYVSAERFLELEEQFSNNKFTLLSARMENIDDIAFLQADYNTRFLGLEYVVQFGGNPFPWTIELARESRLIIPTIVATLLTAFSLVTFIVGIIVIRFRIVSSIEDGMVNMGILKAMGYRNRQIIAAIMLQFGLIAFAGSLLGLVLSYLLLPLFAGIFEPLLGLVWAPAIDVSMSLIAISTLLSLILLFSYFAARRIKKYHPLVALRGGLKTHNFKKNAAALDKARGSLIVLLALKQLLQNKKQAFTIILIIAGLMVSTVIGITTYYNMNVNTDAFVDILVGDTPDIMMLTDGEENTDEAMLRISDRNEVAIVNGSEFVTLFIDDVLSLTTVIENFSYLSSETLLEGRFPQHNNEIVMGATALRVMDKDIGDWVTVMSGSHEQEYLITGSRQGIDAMISVSGMIQLQPEFAFTQYEVTLVEGSDIAAFIEMILAEEEALISVISIQDQIFVSMEATEGVFALITVIILVIAIAVVVLVLYMIIKTTIRRKRRELGIQKAIGFTTLQLMNQISLSVIPTTLIGAIIGGFGGYFGFNPLFVALMSGQGIVEANMFAPIGWIIITYLAFAILAYSISMFIAWQIRKISAYTLVNDQ